MMLFGLLTLAALAQAQDFTALRQVHVVTRHGSRFPLSKNGVTLDEGTPGTLTPLGQKQLFDVGVWLKERYSPQFDDYDEKRVRLESSEFGRTVVSANSLALGLWDVLARDPYGENLLPEVPVNIPVYTTQQENDVYIRAYDNCDSYIQDLNANYESVEWISLEEDNESFLRQLAGIPNFSSYQDETGVIPLHDIWNVFDEIFVAKTECTPDENATTCRRLPDYTVKDVLDEADWLKLQDVAHTAELMKYSEELAGQRVGGNLLSRIASRMRDEGPTDDDGTSLPSFYLYSAHYPTILGLFAALREDPVESEVIPGYATAVVLEYWEEVDGSTSREYVQLHYRASDGTAEPLPLTLSEQCSTIDGSCPLQAVLSTLQSVEEWCRECGNTSADVCLKVALDDAQSGCPAPQPTPPVPQPTPPIPQPTPPTQTSFNEDNPNKNDDERGVPLVAGILLLIALIVGVVGIVLFGEKRKAASPTVTAMTTTSAEPTGGATPALEPAGGAFS